MTNNTAINASRNAARIVGGLFLIAMFTSLTGGIWLESILTAPDYLSTVSENETQVILGVLLEIINCVAVVGIAVTLYPVLNKINEPTAIGYVGFRVIEAVVLLFAAITPLLLVTLSQEYLATGESQAAYFETLGTLMIDWRGLLTGLLTPIFFSIGALLLYYLLYQSQLVPRFISVWGFIAVVALFTWNMLEAFGYSISAGMVFGLPIILNEIFLGIWLIVKGFNPSVAATELV